MNIAERTLHDPVASVEEVDAAAFRRDGFLGPITLFTPAQCALILKHHQLGKRIDAIGWPKGRAASDRFLYDIAARPSIIRLLKPLLGENAILWGVAIIRKEPGAVHHWHTDIESSSGEGFVSIWVGLENTSRESSLRAISRSHRLGKPIQQVNAERQRKRGDTPEETLLEWAQEIDPEAELIVPDMTDGQAIVFDGRLWHGTNNQRREGRRTSLLLQYAAADVPVRIPDFKHYEWPFRFTKQQPPVVAVSGKGNAAVNYVVAPPPAVATAETRKVSTHIQPIALPLPSDPAGGWRAHPFFRAPTAALEYMGCHASVLGPGQCPHPPHAHAEEELLLVLDGEAELVIADSPDPAGARIEQLRPGAFVYYPPYQHHTIRNSSQAPVTYLMFKWRGAPIETSAPRPTTITQYGAEFPLNQGKAWATKVLFEQPTAYLTKLHAHLTELQPGAGYAPHADEYDVGILMLDGKVETLGRVVQPQGVIFYSAGELHGMKNVGDGPARYLVFEFHAPDFDLPETSGLTVARSIHSIPQRIVRELSRFGRKIAGRRAH